MKINGNIVSYAGNFALRARCKVARGTSHSVLVARLRGELRTPCSLQVARGISLDIRHMPPRVEIRTKTGYTVTVMAEKRTDKNSTRSHKKPHKSFAKALDIRRRIGQNSQPRSLAASQLRVNYTRINLHSHTQFSSPHKRTKDIPFPCVFYFLKFYGFERINAMDNR